MAVFELHVACYGVLGVGTPGSLSPRMITVCSGIHVKMIAIYTLNEETVAKRLFSAADPAVAITNVSSTLAIISETMIVC